MSDSATVLEAFKFIESAAAEFSDEDDEEDSEAKDKTVLDLATVSSVHFLDACEMFQKCVLPAVCRLRA